MNHKTIEDTYCLKDAEHKPGSNRYTFKFNMQWRNIIFERLTISVRSIKLWLAPRHLYVDGIQIHTSQGTTPTSFDSIVTGSMSQYNDKLSSMKEALGYRSYYNPVNRRLVFDCVDGNYFPYKSPSEMTSITMSDDMRSITGMNSLADAKVLYTNANGFIEAFCFENVWDRECIHVHASFVDLGYQNFLGVSNEQFIPPKEYPVNYSDSNFTIELYDSAGRPVEIPPIDNKDTLLIELILNSYT